MKRLDFIVLLVISMVIISCLDNVHKIQNTGDPVSILFSPVVGAGDGSENIYLPNAPGSPDRTIQEFRVLVFRTDGSLAYNKKVDLATNNPFELQITTGTYDFFFIANEGSDPALVTQLDAHPGLTMLENLSVASTAFDRLKNIPMVGIYHNVTISQNGGSTTLSGAGISVANNNWAVVVNRLAVRVELSFTCNLELLLDSVQIVQVPNRVFLLQEKGNATPNYNNTLNEGGPYEETPRKISSNAFVTSTDGVNTTWTLNNSGSNNNRIILPANTFADVTNEAKAMTFKIYFRGISTPFIGTLGTETLQNEAGNKLIGFSSPGNTLYRLHGNIGGILEIKLETMEWSIEGVDGDVIIPRELYVSSLGEQLSEGTKKCIYFNSNQKFVHLESTAKDMYGKEIPLATLLENPTSLTNFVYDKNTGTGYMNLKPADSAIPGVYKIYLNAEGLRREITLSMALKSNAYMVPPGNSVLIPVARANESTIYLEESTYNAALNQYEQLQQDTPWSAFLVWESTPGLIGFDESANGVGYSGAAGCFRVIAQNGKSGNAVVGIKDSSGKTLWSWHIWVTTYDGKTTFTSNNGVRDFVFMDRALGAMSITPGDLKSCGLYYQWGRKDPFPGPGQDGGSWNIAVGSDPIRVYDAEGNRVAIQKVEAPQVIPNNITNSVRFPNVYAFHSNPPYDWFAGAYPATQNDNLWSGSPIGATTFVKKSVFDPCPKGWRVAPWVNGVSPFQGLDYSQNPKPYYFANRGFHVRGAEGYNYFPCSGSRDRVSGMYGVSTYAFYWSASPKGTKGSLMYVDGEVWFDAYADAQDSRACGFAIRCCRE